MSIDISTCIAIGWVVDKIEKNAMNAASAFEYEDYFIPLNAYDENTEYIFGEIIQTLQEGETLDISDMLEIANLYQGNLRQLQGKLMYMAGACARKDLYENYRLSIHVFTRYH